MNNKSFKYSGKPEKNNMKYCIPPLCPGNKNKAQLGRSNSSYSLGYVVAWTVFFKKVYPSLNHWYP